MGALWGNEYDDFLLLFHCVLRLTLLGNMGQVCTATSRILVQDTIYERFIKEIQAQTEKVSVLGDPFSEETFQGPQVTRQHYERVLSYIEAGKAEGATLVCCGTKHGDKGYFITPTIFSDVKDHYKINQEEVFGPFLTVRKFSTEDEAIRSANCTSYGLGASVFTKDITKAHRVAAKIEAGMVWINR